MACEHWSVGAPLQAGLDVDPVCIVAQGQLTMSDAAWEQSRGCGRSKGLDLEGDLIPRELCFESSYDS